MRHTDSKKWFGLFGVVDRKKLGIPGEGTVQIERNVWIRRRFIMRIIETEKESFRRM